MDAMRAVPDGDRAVVRREVLDCAAHGWLSRQGERAGFALDPLPAPATRSVGPVGADEDDIVGMGEGRGRAHAGFRVTGYRVLRVDRGARAARLRIGVLDVEGVLTVRDPGAFVFALGTGFGRAKAFGCGLMLVRRARAWA